MSFSEQQCFKTVSTAYRLKALLLVTRNLGLKSSQVPETVRNLRAFLSTIGNFQIREHVIKDKLLNI